MDARNLSGVRRFAVALLLVAGLGGCVYDPSYAAYDPYYPAYGYPSYGYPTYVGPPVSLDLGFGYYSGHRHHGWGRHGGHHGWRSHGGHRGGHYGGHHGDRGGHRRGRH
jgi:hypothetical protein